MAEDVTGAAAEAALQASEVVEKSGLPQLDPAVWPTQIFWLIIALLALYGMLTRIAIPRIAATLEERQEAIAADLDLAAEFTQRAKKAEEDYEAALEAARVEARQIADAAQDKLREKLNAAIAKADGRIAEQAAQSQTRIDAIKARAAQDAAIVAKDVAAALAARVSPAPVDASELGAAVDAKVAQRFGGVGR